MRAPATLKVNVCHESGWLAEGEISYAGARAEARARLAADVLRERLQGARAAARRPDRRGQRVRRRRRPLARRARPTATRATCACASRCDHAERAQAERLGARGDGALHLRPGRRRRRAHRARAARSAPCRACCRASRCRRASRCSSEAAMTHANASPCRCYRAAHGRTGDKGNRSNISVIAWHPALWPLLVEQVTESAVARAVRAPPAEPRARATCCRSCTR